MLPAMFARALQRLALALVLSIALAEPAFARVAAFRFQDLDLRDPHVFFNFLGCRDLTDTELSGYSFNGSLQDKIQTDGDGDGELDLNFVLVFDSFDPAASTSHLTYHECPCTAPMASTRCEGGSGTSIPLDVTQQAASGSICLAPLAGTTHPYSPAIVSSSDPCFVTEPFPLTLQIADVSVPLTSVQIAGTFAVGSPNRIVNGLLRGFLSQSDADATIFPASYPLVGGQPLSKVLAGGTGACPAFSDRDVYAGVNGWWFYFNYSAVEVTYVGAILGVPRTSPAAPALEVAPNPARGAVQFHFRVDDAQPARLAIFDLLGRRVRVLDTGTGSGLREVTWDGRRDSGELAAAGLYVARVGTGESARACRFLLVR
jgi:hypothetical protein